MKRLPSWLKTGLKIAITALILVLVFRQLDLQAAQQALLEAHPAWLLGAAVFFIASKIVSAVRFNTLLAPEGISLLPAPNLRLYWIGMYYNLLLPGGISGDGYKVKLLHDSTGVPVRRLLLVALLDRLGGVAALGQLALALALLLPALQPWWWLWALGLVASIPITAMMFYQLGGKNQLSVWKISALQSLAVQALQLCSALALLAAIGIADHRAGYSLVFLVSSVVAMLPLTIGGTGARELTFLYGAQYASLDAGKAVAIAFLFYLISTAVALTGILFTFKEKDWIRT